MAECGRGWSNRCATATGSTCVCKCGGVNHGSAIGRSPLNAVIRLNLRPSGRDANFRIQYDGPEGLVLLDLGPWDRHATITNDAAGVVQRVASILAGRRLFYFDTEARLDELVVVAGEFSRFATGAPDDLREAMRAQRAPRRAVAV